jgi:hypothetical protein
VANADVSKRAASVYVALPKQTIKAGVIVSARIVQPRLGGGGGTQLDKEEKKMMPNLIKSSVLLD